MLKFTRVLISIGPRDVAHSGLFWKQNICSAKLREIEDQNDLIFIRFIKYHKQRDVKLIYTKRTGIGLKEGCLYIWSRLDCCLNKFNISGVSVILGGGLREGISVGET